MVNETSYYYLVFRIFHPSIAPEEVSDNLGMEPKLSWKVGDPCTAPSGALFKGTRERSYWYASGAFTGKTFGKEINDLLHVLAPARKFLRRITAEGGRSEIYVQLPGGMNIGDTLDSETLAIMVDSKISLAIEVFPHMKLQVN
jgi:hypothetical protein